MPEGPSKVSSNSEPGRGMDLSVQGKCCLKVDAYGRKVSDGRLKLRSWLNKQMRVEMSDGRILLGIFLCTDRDGNVILGSCTEYINPDAWGFSDEPRMLGLVMVPGKHIVRVKHDTESFSGDSQRPSSADHSEIKQTQSVSERGTNTIGIDSKEKRTRLNTCDPIECSQNPLWDPNLSDSPDSEGPRPDTSIKDIQKAVNQSKDGSTITTSPSNKHPHTTSRATSDHPMLHNLYT